MKDKWSLMFFLKNVFKICDINFVKKRERKREREREREKKEEKKNFTRIELIILSETKGMENSLN